jgi:probable addiction module antidote protein
MKKPKNVPYEQDLMESLRRNPKEAVGYLNAALTDGDPGVFLLALKDCIKALGGMTQIARKTGLTREALYRSLSAEGNPEFRGILSLVATLGLELEIKTAKPTRKKTKRQAA